MRISSASCLIVVCADCIEYFVTAKCYVVSETLKSEQNFTVRDLNPGLVGESHKS